MSNYQNGKIYKIISDNTDLIYIGSTILNYLCTRYSNHTCNYRKFINGTGKKQCSSFDILKHGNNKIILIELYPCNSKDELHAREQYYIDLNKSICVNKLKCYVGDGENKEEYKKQSKKEYRIKNIEKIKKQTKQFREENIERLKLNEAEKKKCEICNCECRKGHYNRHCETEKHLNKLNNIIKPKFISTLEPIIKCECGEMISRFTKSRHCKSNRHINAIKLTN
jgi:hypothetical protein